MGRRQTWFTADPHIGHLKVAEVRGFADVDAHDAELARRWDGAVADVDVVWVLGDLSAGGKKAQLRALGWLAERPGTKRLIVGNHDGVHPMHTDAGKLLPEYLRVFESVGLAARRRIGGVEVLLSHFPYPDSTDPADTHNRYEQWRLPNLGAWLLHGHTHGRGRVRGRSIHVGLDAWELTPVPLGAVAALLAGQA